MIHNQIDIARTQDNMIFIKQFGIKTKQHSKIGYSHPIPPFPCPELPCISASSCALLSFRHILYCLRKFP